MALFAKLTKKPVEKHDRSRHGDRGDLCLLVDPFGARRWFARMALKGQKNKNGAPLRTGFGQGGADVVKINQARDRALEYAMGALSAPSFQD